MNMMMLQSRDFYSLFGVPTERFDSTPFVTSRILPTYALATIRMIFSIYSFITIVFSFKWFANHTVIFHIQDIKTPAITYTVGAEGIRYSFSDFSYLSYWGLAFYMLVASIHTFVYARRGYTWLDRWPRVLQLLHSAFYTTITTYPILVSIVYWGSLWTRTWWPDRFSQWNMISIYALNSACAAFEIIIPNTQPFPWAHYSIIVLCMSLYLGVAYITKATEGIYIYRWLDPKNGVKQLILHIVCYAALIIGIYVLVRCVIAIRWRLTNGVPKVSIRGIYENKHAETTYLHDSYEPEMQNSQETKKEVHVPFIHVGTPRSAFVPLDRIDETYLPYEPLEDDNILTHKDLSQYSNGRETSPTRSFHDPSTQCSCETLNAATLQPSQRSASRLSQRSASRLSQRSVSRLSQHSASNLQPPASPPRVTTHSHRFSHQQQLPQQQEPEQHQQQQQQQYRRPRAQSYPIPRPTSRDQAPIIQRHSTRQAPVPLSPTLSLQSRGVPACHEPPPVAYPHPRSRRSANFQRLSQLQAQIHHQQQSPSPSRSQTLRTVSRPESIASLRTTAYRNSWVGVQHQQQQEHDNRLPLLVRIPSLPPAIE